MGLAQMEFKKEAVDDPPTTHRLSKLTLSYIKTLFQKEYCAG